MNRLIKLVGTLLAALSLFALSACSSSQATNTTITVRLWDQNVAEAYDNSFAELYKETGVRAKTVVVPWSEYWTQLRTDLATGSADDIFWTNAGNFAAYARQGLLLPITKRDFASEWSSWDPAVVAQYTDAHTLWGVPQLSDPGIGLLYNKELLAKYGVTEDEVRNISWDPAATTDDLRAISMKLTRDSAGRSAADSTFDPQRVVSYGFNSALDLNAIVLNFLGSNGAAWQDGDRFVFNSENGRETFQYLTNLINIDHVSPPAVETNPPAGGDLSRDLFVQGKMALFETGSYNLANVKAGANFEWGIATIPSGPAGAISVTNGIIAAASTTSRNTTAQREVLKWLGGKGAAYVGQKGAALTAVTSERQSYFDYWKTQGIDISPMVEVLQNGYIQAPRGVNYGKAEEGYLPILSKVFTGELSIDQGIPAAEKAANDAMGE